VINLRGTYNPQPRYEAQRRHCDWLGVRMYDREMGACSLPTAEQVQSLVALIEAAPRPLVIHCYGGGDRSGLAAGVVLLLETDASVAAARRQLSIRFGHWSPGRAAPLHLFYQAYADWLTRNGVGHAPPRFRNWVFEHYDPTTIPGGGREKKPVSAPQAAR
jgi:protein tyrosine phosphatase (PTP) superfamily phosphohydrolase (DUF442 family)